MDSSRHTTQIWEAENVHFQLAEFRGDNLVVGMEVIFDVVAENTGKHNNKAVAITQAQGITKSNVKQAEPNQGQPRSKSEEKKRISREERFDKKHTTSSNPKKNQEPRSSNRSSGHFKDHIKDEPKDF